MGGSLISPELYAQLTEMHNWFKTQKMQTGGAAEAGTQASRTPSRYQPHYVIAKELIPACQDLFTPGKGEVELHQWDPDAEKYEKSLDSFDVFNHTAADIQEDTAAVIFWIDGHWIVFADCDPGTRPETSS